MKNEEVKRVANLARIELSDQESAMIGSQFNDVLAYIEKMNELDLDSAEAASHPFELNNAFRPDEARPSFNKGDMENIAPKFDRNMIVVPKVVDKG